MYNILIINILYLIKLIWNEIILFIRYINYDDTVIVIYCLKCQGEINTENRIRRRLARDLVKMKIHTWKSPKNQRCQMDNGFEVWWGEGERGWQASRSGGYLSFTIQINKKQHSPSTVQLRKNTSYLCSIIRYLANTSSWLVSLLNNRE